MLRQFSHQKCINVIKSTSGVKKKRLDFNKNNNKNKPFRLREKGCKSLLKQHEKRTEEHHNIQFTIRNEKTLAHWKSKKQAQLKTKIALFLPIKAGKL